MSSGRQKYLAYMADYTTYHKTEGNKLTHVVGVPMIVMAVLGLLNRVVLVDFGFLVQGSLALVAYVLTNGFYLYLNPLLGSSMIFSTGVLLLAGALTPVPVLIVLFVVGWVFQFLGHALYEKKSPAFFKNFLHLLVGPLFVQRMLLRFKDE